MGKFSEKVLDKFLKQDMYKSGCVKRGIYITISIVFTLVVIIFAVIHTVNEAKIDGDMIRFVELVSKDYSGFEENVGIAQVENFKSNVMSNTSLPDSEVYQGENFDIDGFLSKDLVVAEGFKLDFFDLAVLLNYHWASELLRVVEVDTLSAEFFYWHILLCVDFSTLKKEKDVGDSAPSKIFISFSARLNLEDEQWGVKGYDMQVNRLQGEENKFAVNKICELLKITEETLTEYALYPFTFTKAQASIWNREVNFDTNAFTFNKKNLA